MTTLAIVTRTFLDNRLRIWYMSLLISVKEGSKNNVNVRNSEFLVEPFIDLDSVSGNLVPGSFDHTLQVEQVGIAPK